jgi:hypothetical protein
MKDVEGLPAALKPYSKAIYLAYIKRFMSSYSFSEGVSFYL